MGRVVLVAIGGVLIVGAFFLAKHRARPFRARRRRSRSRPPRALPRRPWTRALRNPRCRIPFPSDAVSHRELPPLDRSDAYVSRVLRELLGRKPVASFLNLDDFARRFVATVSNLASDSASPQRWPVRETPGRFESGARGEHLVISSRNAARYAPFVSFAEAIDSRKAVATYVAMYPLLQRAYEELGEPIPYFNDRVVAVIDDLLATPDIGEPVPRETHQRRRRLAIPHRRAAHAVRRSIAREPNRRPKEDT